MALLQENQSHEGSMAGGRLWTPEEIRHLHEHPERTDRELAEDLGRSLAAIRVYRSKTGVQYLRAWRPWTIREEHYLAEVFAVMPVEEIAEELKRSVAAVAKRAERMGLKKRQGGRAA